MGVVKSNPIVCDTRLAQQCSWLNKQWVELCNGQTTTGDSFSPAMREAYHTYPHDATRIASIIRLVEQVKEERWYWLLSLNGR